MDNSGASIPQTMVENLEQVAPIFQQEQTELSKTEISFVETAIREQLPTPSSTSQSDDTSANSTTVVIEESITIQTLETTNNILLEVNEKNEIDTTDSIMEGIANKKENGENGEDGGHKGDTDESDSSDSDSDSSSAASELSDISSSDGEADQKMNKLLLEDDEEVHESRGNSTPWRSKNELQELPAVEPLDNIVITEQHKLELVGVIESIVEDQVVVTSTVSRDQALDLDSVLCLEGRTPLGRVFDVLGPVTKPFYSVIIPPTINRETLVPKSPVYYVPDYATFVDPKQIYSKGYDASNQDDEEVASGEEEFSDDEKEQLAKKAALDRKKKAREANKGENGQSGQNQRNTKRRFQNKTYQRNQNQQPNPNLNPNPNSNPNFNFQQNGNMYQQQYPYPQQQFQYPPMPHPHYLPFNPNQPGNNTNNMNYLPQFYHPQQYPPQQFPSQHPPQQYPPQHPPQQYHPHNNTNPNINSVNNPNMYPEFQFPQVPPPVVQQQQQSSQQPST